jgi:tetratricopeptide (TPR) repeat protein
MRLLFFCTLWLGLTTILSAQQFSKTAQKAYVQILTLDSAEVAGTIELLRATEPNNPIAEYLDNYWDFFQLFIHENPEHYGISYPKKAERIKKIQLQGTPESPLYLYTQADIYLQWAILEAKFRDFFTAFRDIKRAYRLLEKNQARFPAFDLNDKNMGILISLVGTLPDEYRWGFEWISGIPGDLQEGEKRLKNALQSKSDFATLHKDETRVLYSLLLLHVFKQTDEAWGLLQELDLNHQESDLAVFLLANTSLRLKRINEANQYLEEALSEGTADVPHLYYLKGLIELYRGQYEASRHYLETFISEFKGIHYRKSAWLYISYTYYLEENIPSYDWARLRCLTEGDNLVDEDKFAEAQSEKRNLPDKDLLAIRLSFDGGNYQRTFDLIQEELQQPLDPTSFKFLSYYKARVQQETGAIEQAIEQFKEVYEMPDRSESYFAINAALQIGLLLIEKEQCKEAHHWLNKCLETSSEAYQASIHQKAKAAILRCELSHQ